MRWKTPALLSLLFLGAAAAPPNGCPANGDTACTLPVPLDPAGQPNFPTGLAGPNFATLPNAEAAIGCGDAAPSVMPPTTLRSESGDVLHGLSAPDLLRPINEPRQSPRFQ